MDLNFYSQCQVETVSFDYTSDEQFLWWVIALCLATLINTQQRCVSHFSPSLQTLLWLANKTPLKAVRILMPATELSLWVCDVTAAAKR